MLNKVILIGRLTKDPELKYTPSNVAVTSFTLAVDRKFARQGEERGTDFINIVAWRSTAEFVSKYFTKGRPMAVCGQIQTRTWDDNEGKRHYVTEVVADEVSFVESKRDAGEGTGFVAQAPVNPQNNAQQPQTNPDFEVVPDDELPF
ncbi:MAG: single-stranded DNA-binding protein [Clostridia bacterium]|nr:single-stranded DNA-binding protein [Clostridia bacterium]